VAYCIKTSLCIDQDIVVIILLITVYSVYGLVLKIYIEETRLLQNRLQEIAFMQVCNFEISLNVTQAHKKWRYLISYDTSYYLSIVTILPKV